MAELRPGTSIVGVEKVPGSEDKDRLIAWTAEATLKYSIHDYDGAAELYSQATELQAGLNGEMSSLNADLLYQYGRCLYHVAVRKSDVLGSKVAGEKPEERSLESSRTQQPKKRKPIEKEAEDTGVTHEVIATGVEETETSDKNKEKLQRENKPFFQFTGDENFEDSDEDEDSVGGIIGDEDVGDEEDDFANAYEVLDLARILLLRRLEETQECEREPHDLKHLKERLADTYDLQAEILLEGERFPLAVADLKAALELKQALFPRQSSLIAEAHYKLSLALEFSSVTEQKDTHANVEDGAQAIVDQEMREAAAKEMEAAIESCRLRLKEEEANMEKSSSCDKENVKLGEARRNIQEVKEIVNDMEQRVGSFPIENLKVRPKTNREQLIELRQPPFSINDRTGMDTIEGVNPLNGILGSILSESPAIQKKKLEAASIGAADLTNLIKRKTVATTQKVDQDTEANALKSNGKRKIGLVEEAVDVDLGKKVKLSDADDN